MVTRRPNAVIVISLALAGAILAIAIWVLAQMREDALRRAQDSAENVSLLVERDVARNLELYDLSLLAVICVALSGWKRPVTSSSTLASELLRATQAGVCGACA